MKNIPIGDDLHRRLKRASVEEGRPMGRIVEELIEGYLAGPVMTSGDVTVMSVGVTSPPIRVSGKTTNRIDLSKSAQAKGRMHGG